MSTLEELDAAIKIVGEERVHCIMHCTSTYPTKTEEMNLLCIPVLQKRYPWATIGFSNHHPGIVFMPAAVALGAKIVEFHITMDKTMYGSDQAASFNPEGVFKAVKYMREVEKSLGDGIKRVFDSEIPIREKLRR
jgi:N-acetylneuraminate synthase